MAAAAHITAGWALRTPCRAGTHRAGRLSPTRGPVTGGVPLRPGQAERMQVLQKWDTGSPTEPGTDRVVLSSALVKGGVPHRTSRHLLGSWKRSWPGPGWLQGHGADCTVSQVPPVCLEGGRGLTHWVSVSPPRDVCRTVPSRLPGGCPPPPVRAGGSLLPALRPTLIRRSSHRRGSARSVSCLPGGGPCPQSPQAHKSPRGLDSGLPSGHTCWALPRPGGGAAVLRHPRPPPGSSRQWGGAGRDREALGVSLRPRQTPQAPPRSAAGRPDPAQACSSALSLCPLRTRRSPQPTKSWGGSGHLK